MIILFVLFLALYVSGGTGYYDFSNHNKSILTKEAMEKFEEDINQGKNVDLENYMKDTTQDYSNQVSNAALSVSNKIDEYTTKGLTILIKGINALVG